MKHVTDICDDRWKRFQIFCSCLLVAFAFALQASFFLTCLARSLLVPVSHFLSFICQLCQRTLTINIALTSVNHCHLQVTSLGLESSTREDQIALLLSHSLSISLTDSSKQHSNGSVRKD